MNTRALQNKLERARWWLIGHQPFYGALAMRLPDKLEGCPVKTACTNSREILWHPPFLEGLTDEETRAVLAHEVLHNAHGHFWRMDPRDPDAQMAADHAINLTLTAAGFVLPQPHLADPRFRDRAEEEILAALKREKKPDPDGKQTTPGSGNGQGDAPQDPGGCGGFIPPPMPDGKEPQTPKQHAQAKEAAKAEWQRHVIEAVQSAKLQGRGDVPRDLARLADAATRPAPVDWRQETAEFLKTATGSRNDWSRSARRHAWQPVVYPRRQRDTVGLIIAAVDTSGSIDDVTYSEFTATLAAAQAELGCELLLIHCDETIHAERRVAVGEPMPPDAPGGGGTDLRPPFTRAAELAQDGETIAGIVYLTDLEGPEPAAVDFPTLWLVKNSYRQPEAKTGRTVQI